jgi:molybdopterin converting factor small subunit
MTTVVLPGALRPLAGGARTLTVAGGRPLTDLLDSLDAQYPALARRLRDEQGQLRRYVNLYVDGADVRGTGGLATVVNDGAELFVVPSVAGG